MLDPQTTALEQVLLNQVQTGAERERQKNFQTCDVEGDRAPSEHDVIRPQRQVLPNTADCIFERSMADAHTLRLARRTGSVDHISDAVCGNHPRSRDLRRQERRRWRGPEIFEIDHLGSGTGEPATQFVESEHKGRGRIFQNKGDALGWCGWVERYVGAAGLPYAEQCGDHLRRAVKKNSHQGATFHAGLFQSVRDPVYGQIQFTIGDLPTFTHYG